MIGVPFLRPMWEMSLILSILVGRWSVVSSMAGSRLLYRVRISYWPQASDRFFLLFWIFMEISGISCLRPSSSGRIRHLRWRVEDMLGFARLPAADRLVPDRLDNGRSASSRPSGARSLALPRPTGSRRSTPSSPAGGPLRDLIYLPCSPIDTIQVLTLRFFSSYDEESATSVGLIMVLFGITISGLTDFSRAARQQLAS